MFTQSLDPMASGTSEDLKFHLYFLSYSISVLKGGNSLGEMVSGGSGWDGAVKGCLELPHPPPNVSHPAGSPKAQSTFAEQLVSHREGPAAHVGLW